MRGECRFFRGGVLPVRDTAGVPVLVDDRAVPQNREWILFWRTWY